MARTNKASRRGASGRGAKTWLWVGLAAVIVIAIGGALFWQGTNAAAIAYPDEVTIAEAYAKVQAGAFLLDVRQPEEWEAAHVPGATLIPLGELQTRVNEVPRDREVVVICRSGNRSQQGRDILRAAGFTQVTSAAGGVTQWAAAGYPTVSGP